MTGLDTTTGGIASVSAVILINHDQAAKSSCRAGKGNRMWLERDVIGGSYPQLLRLDDIGTLELLWLSDSPQVIERQLVIEDSRGRVHIVKNGETLYSLAKRYGLTLENLLALNCFTKADATGLKINQRLLMAKPGRACGP